MNSNKQIIDDAFKGWANGTANFFDLLDQDVQWTIEGHTQLSRTFVGKQQFLDQVIKPVNERLSEKIIPNVTGIYADGDMVVVLWNGQAMTLGGEPFNLSYCWILELKEGKIVKATAFLDGVVYTSFLKTRPGELIQF